MSQTILNVLTYYYMFSDFIVAIVVKVEFTARFNFYNTLHEIHVHIMKYDF